jgi:hypothetical protein
MVIEQEDVAEILNAAFPEFESEIAEHRKDWGNDPMLYLLVGALFRFADELPPGRERALRAQRVYAVTDGDALGRIAIGSGLLCNRNDRAIDGDRSLVARNCVATAERFKPLIRLSGKGASQMKGLNLRRCALCSCVAAAMLAACGASQQPIGAPGAILQSRAVATTGNLGTSWRLPETKSRDLLYVVTGGGAVDILSYPGSKLLGTLRSAKDSYAPITANPTNGDILIAGRGAVIDEYAHGGQQVIAEIYPPPSIQGIVDYAFDPTTESIAVSLQKSFDKGFVGIYATPSASPTLYSVPNMKYLGFLGYDNQGNLFIEGKESSNGPDVFAELPKGSSAFNDVTLNQSLTNLGTVQWDGSYITLASGNTINEIQISGSNGTIVGETTLGGEWVRYPVFWIQGDAVLGDHVTRTNRYNGQGIWHYPQGGRAYKVIKYSSQHDRVLSEAVSVGSR